MWTDDTDFPSVEDREDEDQLPEHDLEWADWWEDNTYQSPVEERWIPPSKRTAP